MLSTAVFAVFVELVFVVLVFVLLMVVHSLAWG